MDKPLFQQLKAGFSNVVDYSYEINEPNVICTLKGSVPDEGAIVVGGHFDLVEVGTGAVDDWSGAVLLPSLYQTLTAQPHRHDFVFVAFAVS